MNFNRRLRYTAWLALLAMLMIFVAPVVSQSLAMAHAAASHDAVLSGHVHGEPDPVPIDHSDHDLDECGYCTLLTQLPALGGGGGLVSDAAMLRGEPVRHGCRTPHTIKAGFPDALPRAPPALSYDNESLPGA